MVTEGKKDVFTHKNVVYIWIWGVFLWLDTPRLMHKYSSKNFQTRPPVTELIKRNEGLYYIWIDHQ